MMNLTQFILIVFGFCSCVSLAKPLKPFREFITKKSLTIGEFLNCPKCMSIWASPFAYYYIYKEISLDMIPFAFIAFGSVYILENIKTCK